MSRFNQILAVILVAQIALAAFVLWPRAAASSGGGPLLPDYKAADVTGLTLSDSEGNRLALAKNGDNWVLPEADDYPVDSAKVTPLLDKIEKIRTNRLVTQTEGSHSRLKVAANDFNSLVEIQLKDGSSHKLYIGSSAGAAATHVRADDNPEVYLAGDINSFEASPQAGSWVDTLYFTVPQTATTSLTLENANGTFEFTKEGEQWTMPGLAGDETFNENNFTSLFSQASGIRLTKPLGKTEDPAYGLDKPQAVITLKTADKTYTLSIGAKDDTDNTYVVKSSESPYYVRVSEGLVNTFLEKKRADFLQAPPTAEPGAEATPAP
ncbi:MAG: hypothetical protein BroJett011_45230 [Chloroflexota bacterium]|nr:MAG: hypothetical protein BroJett011_45230 [Chloroflexota bacterium]